MKRSKTANTDVRLLHLAYGFFHKFVAAFGRMRRKELDVESGRNRCQDSRAAHRRLVRRAFVYGFRVQMINAAITPGIHPHSHNSVTIRMLPQPLSYTASGGSKMQTIARSKLILLSFRQCGGCCRIKTLASTMANGEHCFQTAENRCYTPRYHD